MNSPIHNSQFAIRNSPVLALLFDFGGTLDSDGVPWKERFFRLCREEGVTVSSERFDSAFYAADDALVGAVPPSLGLRATVEQLARGLAEALEISDPAMPRRVADRFHSEASARLSESVRLLQRLAPRYRLGVVSNFYGNLAGVCEETGIGRSLGVAVDSAAVGFRKPDPRIFQEALKALGAQPAETVFVGDSVPRDMAGARGIGMRHVWLKAPDSNGAAQPCCPGDPVIRRLAELEEIVP